MFSMFSRLKDTMSSWLKKTWNKVKNFVPQEKPFLLVIMITLLIVLVMEIIHAIFFTDDKITRDFCYQIWGNQAMECSPVYFHLFKSFYVIVKYTSQATIILMIVVFVYLLIGWRRHAKLLGGTVNLKKLCCEAKAKNEYVDLEELRKIKEDDKDLKTKGLVEVLIGTLSASAIPTGLSLIVCSFYNLNLIKYMGGVEIYIAFAGISIISIAFLSMMREDRFISDISTKINSLDELWEKRLKSSEDSHHNGNASEKENPSEKNE